MNLRFNRYLYKSSKYQFMCTIYHSLFNAERAVAIKSNSMFNLTDLMTISLPKADRKNLC